MPTTSPTSGVFDLTFDATFQGLLISDATPSVEGCRAPGAYLTWLSPVGWMYWLFEGPMSVGKAVVSRGRKRQGGLSSAIQKETAATLTARTSGLTREQAEVVATCYDADKVYLLAPDESDVFHLIPADINEGDIAVYDSRSHTSSLTVQLTLPARRSARG